MRRSRTGQSSAAGASAGSFDLDVAILEYARNGSQIHTEFEDAQPAYLVFVQQQGSATTPSATFQLRENLGNYLRATAAAATDEEKATGNVPCSLTDLAPLLQSSQFSSCLCSAIQNPFSSCPPPFRSMPPHLDRDHSIPFSQAAMCQLLWSFSAGPPWHTVCYVGGGPEGLPAMLEHFSAFITWRQTQESSLQVPKIRLWCPAEIDQEALLDAVPFPVEYQGVQHPVWRLRDAPDQVLEVMSPSTPSHRTIRQAAFTSSSPGHPMLAVSPLCKLGFLARTALAAGFTLLVPSPTTASPSSARSPLPWLTPSTAWTSPKTWTLRRSQSSRAHSAADRLGL